MFFFWFFFSFLTYMSSLRIKETDIVWTKEIHQCKNKCWVRKNIANKLTCIEFNVYVSLHFAFVSKRHKSRHQRLDARGPSSIPLPQYTRIPLSNDQLVANKTTTNTRLNFHCSIVSVMHGEHTETARRVSLSNGNHLSLGNRDWPRIMLWRQGKQTFGPVYSLRV